MNTERKTAAELIRQALSIQPWSTPAEMAQCTGADVKTLSNQLGKLRMLGQVEYKREGNRSVWALRDTTVQAPAPNVALPRRVEVPKGKPYTCPELRSHHDLPRARLAAFDMPSRMGDRLHYRDGRVEVVA